MRKLSGQKSGKPETVCGITYSRLNVFDALAKGTLKLSDLPLMTSSCATSVQGGSAVGPYLADELAAKAVLLVFGINTVTRFLSSFLEAYIASCLHAFYLCRDSILAVTWTSSLGFSTATEALFVPRA